MNPLRHRPLASAFVLGMVLVGLTALPGLAQGRRDRGFGNFGGGRGFGGGSFDYLTRENTEAELKLTDDQKAKIKEMIEELRNAQSQNAGAPQIDFRTATEEERAAWMSQMEKQREESRKQGETKLKAILSSDQFTRANQLWLHSLGVRALQREDVAAELKLSDAQKAEIKKVQDEARQKMMGGGNNGGRGIGFGQSFNREAFEAAQKETETKILAVLTADQKKAWETKLGPAPLELKTDTAGSTPTAPGGTAPLPGTSTDKAVTGTPAPRGPLYEPTKPKDASVVADLAPKDGNDAPAKDPGEKRISFNFRFAPWEEVLKLFSKEMDLSLEMNKVPPGTFNYYDKKSYTIPEAIDIVNGHLLQKGFLLINRDRFLVVWSVDDPVPANLIPDVSPDELPKRGRFELLTITIPLEGIDTAAALEEVKEMLGPQGKAVPLSKTNRLMVTDIGSNLQRIYRNLTGAGAVLDKTATTFKSFPLKHVSALDAERTVRDLFGLPARGKTTTVAAAPAPNTQQARPQWGWGQQFGGGDFGGRRWGRDGGSDQQASPQTVATTTTTTTAPANSAKDAIQVSSDSRTNRLFVTATPDKLKIIEDIIKDLDVDEDGAGNRINRSLNTPQLEIYPLQNVDMAVAIEQINAIIPGLQITQDAKGNRITVYATPDEQAQVRGIIKQLDGDAALGNKGLVSVIYLKKHDATAAAATVRNLFSSRNQDAPGIEADNVGRRILVRGTQEQVSSIKKLMADMGEDGLAPTLNDTSGGNVRSFSVGNRNPEEFIATLKALWGESNTNPIRIVVPSASSPSIDRRLPPARTETPGQESSQKPAPVPAGKSVATDKPVEVLKTSQESVPCGDQEPEDEPAEKAPAKSDKPVENKPAQEDSPKASANGGSAPMPLNVTVLGDRVVVTSDDIQALNRLEAMVQTLNQATSNRMTWTVFYLRSMDATEAATLLGQLLPTSSVAKAEDSSSIMGSLTGSLSSLGSGLMDVSGLNSLGTSTPLRIVPEPRSNGLFVSGPASQVKQIQDLLEVLDADELPATLKDRVPRTIAVLHANVNEVKAIIEDVYKEQLQGNNPLQQGGRNGNQGQVNPLALLMGAAQGGGGKGRGVQMTLGVDEKTNTLIVSASDSLFKQVEGMVKTVDKLAMEAEDTVQVISLEHANSTMVQQALTSLVGKVNVSSTAQRSQSTGNNNNQNPFGGGQPFGGLPFGQGINPGQFGTRGGGDTNNSGGRFGRGNFGGGNNNNGNGFQGFGRGNFGGGNNNNDGGGGQGFGRGNRGGN